jgi:hypothetical protein
MVYSNEENVQMLLSYAGCGNIWSDNELSSYAPRHILKSRNRFDRLFLVLLGTFVEQEVLIHGSEIYVKLVRTKLKLQILLIVVLERVIVQFLKCIQHS